MRRTTACSSSRKAARPLFCPSRTRRRSPISCLSSTRRPLSGVCAGTIRRFASSGPPSPPSSPKRTAAGLILWASAGSSRPPLRGRQPRSSSPGAPRGVNGAGTPIRVGMVGAGFMARGIARQMLHYTKGMELVAISNRHLEGARKAYAESGQSNVPHVRGVDELDDCIARGQRAITDDPMLLCNANGIDAILEVTGTIEFAADVVMRAIARAKHVVMMNAELDGTLGPILKIYADRAGVVITNTEGDQPGVIMNLYRWVKGLGIRPVLCGNIKGLHDPYRNPTTQEAFAKRWGSTAPMTTPLW